MALVTPRLKAMIFKEIWALLRDPRGRVMLFIPPLIQLFLFTFAATLEVKNVDVGLLDRSGGATSAEFVQRLSGSANFREIVVLHSQEELRQAIEDQQVIAAIIIEEGFDRDVARGNPATIGVVLDGRRSNAAQIVGSYLGAIAASVGADLAPRPAPPGSITVNWFNPNLDYIWFNLPGLLVLIVTVSGLAVTSQAIARERELGTFEQLLVSPLRVHEILIGKMMPTFLVGLINGMIFLLAAQIVFGVPFTGNFPLFFLALSAYNISLVGLGLLVSAASMTQQQAFLGSFVVSTPVILLSGFASPVENMPGWLQVLTYANPARHFLQVSLGSFLKGMPAEVILSLSWPLLVIAAVTLGGALWLFRARME